MTGNPMVRKIWTPFWRKKDFKKSTTLNEARPSLQKKQYTMVQVETVASYLYRRREINYITLQG